MRFFDADVLYGIPTPRRLYPFVPDSRMLREKLQRFGIAKAVVSREEQFFHHAAAANMQLADDIREFPELFGIWTILPPHCHEIPEPEEMAALMRQHRIVGWQFFPGPHCYCFHPRVLHPWFELAEKHHIPLFIDLAQVEQHHLYAVLERYPELTVILRNRSVWPPDREIRPFLTEFPRTYLQLSLYLVPGGLESLAAAGLIRRVLFATRFQTSHVGGPMMLLKHAILSEEDKQLVAAENLERILGEINYV